MKIDIIRIPQYSSKKVNLIIVDGQPLCTCRGNFATQTIMAKLQGYDVKMNDGRIEKMIEKLLGRN